jgi:hypothetical protein
MAFAVDDASTPSTVNSSVSSRSLLTRTVRHRAPCGFATVRLEALGSHRFETRYIVSFTIVSKKRSKITLRVPQNSQGIFALPLTFIGRLYFRL